MTSSAFSLSNFLKFANEWWGPWCTLEVFQIYFGTHLAMTYCSTFTAYSRFYKWFRCQKTSGLQMSEERGYGQTACRFYGIFPAPKFSDVKYFDLSGRFFIGSLITNAVINAVMFSESFINDNALMESSSISSTQLICLVFPIICLVSCLSALVSYHLYHSQIYPEAFSGAHPTVLISSTLLFLICYNLGKVEIGLGAAATPKRTGKVNEIASEIFELELFISFLMKLLIAMAYFSAACSKLGESFKKGRNWMDGSSLQGLIFEALFLSDEGWGERAEKLRREVIEKNNGMRDRYGISSFHESDRQGSVPHGSDPGLAAEKMNTSSNENVLPGDSLGPSGPHLPHWSFGWYTPHSNLVQRWCMDKPNLLCMMSILAVFAEGAAPIILLPNIFLPITSIESPWTIYLPWFSFLYAIIGFCLHFGILYLQNVNFLSFWVPCYVMIYDPVIRLQSSSSVSITSFSIIPQNPIFDKSPIALSIAFSYIILHLFMQVYLHLYPEKPKLPFSAFKMFCDIKDLFDGNYSKVFWLSDKPHCAGTLKNYAFPFAQPMHVTENELTNLEYKYIAVRHGGKEGISASSNEISTTAEESINGIDRYDKNMKPDSLNHLLKRPLLSFPAKHPNSESHVSRPKEMKIWSNLHISESFMQELTELERLGRLGVGEWRKSKNVNDLLACVSRLRSEFSTANRL